MDTVAFSLPAERQVRGYTVRRLPLGAYLRAAETLRALPDTALQALAPGQSAGGALKTLRSLTPETAIPVLLRGLSALPGPIVQAVSLLTGVPEDALLTDPALGADGLMELLQAVAEVNDLANFTRAARSLLARLKKTDTGCNG